MTFIRFKRFEDVQVGDVGTLTKTIGHDEIRRFVDLTGDDNPLHVDPEFAGRTPFKDVVVHGMLGASFISTVIGTKLPGPGALWVSQSFEFSLPVRLGDTLEVTCQVVRKHERDRLLDLEMRIANQHGQVVLKGAGKVKVLERPEVDARAELEPPRVAIVTGGAGDIGRAICRRLVADGFRVVVNHLSGRGRAEELVRELSAESSETRAVAVQADVSSPDGVRELHEEALRRFGSVTAVVNAASPRIVARSLEALDWAELVRHLEVQVKSALLMTQACAPSMIAAGGGRVVNITSEAIDGAPVVGWTAYAVAKSGLSTLSRYLAAELGPKNITVNCVSPGMTDTRFIGGISEKQQVMAARQKPLRRLATPEDVAGAVAFLLSPSGAYVTGHTLRVNGGGAMS
ncbi:MAG TPA: SDR family oxidoreductase [Myxococcota bacterium]|nr:SDR family oxidoreductase [Myxococcota bacterium]